MCTPLRAGENLRLDRRCSGRQFGPERLQNQSHSAAELARGKINGADCGGLGQLATHGTPFTETNENQRRRLYSYCHETSAGSGYRVVAQKGPTTMTIHTAIKLPAQNLEPKAFAPYGEIVRPCTSSAETAVEEHKLTLSNGTPRLWIMDLKRRGLVFADMARHRRVSQCLGSKQGREWFIGVAPPNDLADGTRPELEPDCGVSNSGRLPDQASRWHLARWPALRQ